jgi:hypothetical protein
MSDQPSTDSTEPNTRSDAQAADFAPQWGAGAPRGGKAVVNRALKEGSTVPLFLGQTLINSLRDLGYNSTTSAICEHVDNSLEAEATEVRVYFRQTGKQPNQRIDVLVYDNGRGMSQNVLKVAMAFGGSLRFDNRGGMGRYGMGMKAAALNMTRSVDVYSWQEPGAFYSMTLDVDEIGKDRKDMIALPDPQLTDALPTEITTVLTKHLGTSRQADDDDMLVADADELTERLGRSGTIVYMPKCDRLSYRTDKTLVMHAMIDMGRIYRRFIDKGVRLYVNNRRVEAFDPTYWMLSSRHTRVDGLIETRSQLVDSFTVQVPDEEGSPNTSEVRVRQYLLPVQSWANLPRSVLKNALQVFDDHTVSFMRNGREVEIGSEPKLKIKKHHLNAWFRVEIDFTAQADEAFGVAANKQGVRLKEYAADAIREAFDGRLGKNVSAMRKQIAARQYEAVAAEQAGQAGEAERLASGADALQAVALPQPPTDTPEQALALEANLKGLAATLRQDGETEEQAFERVNSSKFLTDIRHQEYAPFYDTEYKFGKLILRVNSAHPFYQKVWQPLCDLARNAAGAEVDAEGVGGDSSDTGRRALMGLQMMLLSLARAQAQMTAGDTQSEQVQLFRNLRKAWSDVMETQFLHV